MSQMQAEQDFSDDNAGQGTAEIGGLDGGQAVGAKKPKYDRVFIRNFKIVLGAAALTTGVVAVLFIRSQGAAADRGNDQVTSVVAAPANKVGNTGEALTQPELNRIERVNQAESASAAKKGETFIPANLPLTPGMTTPNDSPLPGGPPPGSYNVNAGRQNGDAAVNPRDQMRTAGLQVQMARIMGAMEAPDVSSAGPYKTVGVQQGALSQASAQGLQPSQAGNGKSLEPSLVKGLSIHAATLASPLDTEKTDYVSARVVGGNADGAILFGTGRVVNKEGVRITFNRMSLNGLSFNINAVALDTETASNAMTADIDRKIFSRYVIPVVGTALSAYAEAVSQPERSVVVGANGGITIASPAATVKQAAGAGVAAGIKQVTAAASYTGPNIARMPSGSMLGVLFMEPVMASASANNGAMQRQVASSEEAVQAPGVLPWQQTTAPQQPSQQQLMQQQALQQMLLQQQAAGALAGSGVRMQAQPGFGGE